MMKPTISAAILLFAGLIGAIVGAAIFFVPVTFHQSAGIAVADNANLLSEIRAPGALMLTSSVLILTSLFVKTWRYGAAVLGALLYLTYGVSRVLSVAFDGMPSTELQLIAAFELVIGSLCVIALINYRPADSA